MPRVAYVWLVVAVVTLLGSLRTGALIDVVFRVQWLALALAAFALARITTSAAKADWVLQRLSWSAAAITVGFLAALLIDPEAAMRPGQNRFEPWGIGSNTAGHMLVFAAPLFAYRLTLPDSHRYVWAVALSVSFGMAIISGARTTLAGMVLIVVPLAIVALLRMSKQRRSAQAGMAILAVLLIAAVGVLSLPEHVRFDRYATLESPPRHEINRSYLTAISDRPLTGLLFTEGQAGLHGSEQQHSHNIYLAWAYLGGIPLAVLMTAAALYSVRGAVRLVGRHQDMGLILLGVVVAGWATGLTTVHIFHPSHPLALLHTYAALLAVRAAPGRHRKGEHIPLPQAAQPAVPLLRCTQPREGRALPLQTPLHLRSGRRRHLDNREAPVRVKAKM